jgi:hypothetical protein
MMCTRSIKDHVLNIPEPSAYHGQAPCAPPHGQEPLLPPPHPPVSLEQLLATKNELMRMLVESDACHGAGHPQHPHHQDMDSSYSDFLVTHPTLFTKPTDPLEADNWLCSTESKFRLLHCTKYQKTMYAGQQHRGSTGA